VASLTSQQRFHSCSEFLRSKEFISLKGRERPDGRISLQEVKITIEDLGTLLEEMKNKTQ
jgi:hypothetical protein